MDAKEAQPDMGVEVVGPLGSDPDWERNPHLHVARGSFATIVKPHPSNPEYYLLRFDEGMEAQVGNKWWKAAWFAFRSDPQSKFTRRPPYDCTYQVGDKVFASGPADGDEQHCPVWESGMETDEDQFLEVIAIRWHWRRDEYGRSVQKDCQKDGYKLPVGENWQNTDGHWVVSCSNGYDYDEDWLDFSGDNGEEDGHNTNELNDGSHEDSHKETKRTMSKTEVKNKAKLKDVAIVRGGDQITLPDGMSYAEGREWLSRKEEEEQRTVSVREVIEGFPMDGAHALSLALARKYGWVNHVPTPGFWGDTPPQMLAVETGLDESGQVITKQIPWGRLSIPKWEGGHLNTSIEPKPGSALPQFVLVGNMKKKWAHEVEEVARLTREILRERSIYRGKAMQIKLPEPGEPFDPRVAPRFIRTDTVDPSTLIFPKDVEAAIQDNLWSLIQGTGAAREDGVPLKRGILFAGPYGVGKTLTSAVTARYCVQNGWTFILLENITQLAAAMAFARQYQPAVLFAEDIDSVVQGQRNMDMNTILNTIDGVDSKGSELMVVLSTNHVEKINKAMLRPGRIDAVIHVRPPDADAAIRLIEVYGKNLLDKTVEGFEKGMEKVGLKLNGLIPAVIREVVERSKGSAISRWLKNGRHGTRRITPTDLERSADSMQMHLKLLEPAPEPVHPIAILGAAAGTAIGAGVMQAVSKALDKDARGVHDEVFKDASAVVLNVAEKMRPMAAAAAGNGDGE